MIQGIVYSKALALGAGVALLAAVSAAGWHLQAAAAAAEERGSDVRQARELRQSIARKAEFDDAHLEAARVRAAGHPVPLAAEGAWQEWTAALGPGWQVSVPEVRIHPACVVRLATARLVAPSVGDWPKVVAAVGEIERRPGFGVLEVELASGGDHHHRTMDTVRLVVAMGARRPAAETASP
jgi:hypothetical protein